MNNYRYHQQPSTVVQNKAHHELKLPTIDKYQSLTPIMKSKLRMDEQRRNAPFMQQRTLDPTGSIGSLALTQQDC